MPRTKYILLQHAISAYLKRCRSKGLTLSTLRWYEQKLERFRSYLAVQHITSITPLTPAHIQAFLTSLEDPERGGKPVAAATIKGYRQVLQGFFRWCVHTGRLQRNPMQERSGSR